MPTYFYVNINPHSDNNSILYAKELLRYFVNMCESLYGNYFSIYNVHMLIHIADD